MQHTITFLNLDLIVAIGFQVRSPRGTQFRQLTTAHLPEFVVPPKLDLTTFSSGDKNCLIAEYTLRDIHEPIGVAGWETKLVESLPKNLRGSLPTIEELEAELSRKPASTKPPKRRRRTDA